MAVEENTKKKSQKNHKNYWHYQKKGLKKNAKKKTCLRPSPPCTEANMGETKRTKAWKRTCKWRCWASLNSYGHMDRRRAWPQKPWTIAMYSGGANIPTNFCVLPLWLFLNPSKKLKSSDSVVWAAKNMLDVVCMVMRLCCKLLWCIFLECRSGIDQKVLVLNAYEMGFHGFHF